ncbi:enoyl-CoA hydratase/isomerase family protein [Nocardioides aquiterrae]|uniref:Enoyl-CoA hydratase n=1 Tax=Nocardioides aquiterrae TaxID=203799 RepID=A0ABN1UC94_9ACTN
MSAVQHRDGPHGARMLLLDAPERRNALRLGMLDALSAGLSEDPDRTVVIASSTPGIFCAGADLRVPDEERASISDRLYELYELMVTRPGVVVALVDGAAVGGGAQLATAADLRIVTGRARFRWVGPGHGLAVGAWILPHLVGRTAALDLALTARWVDAPAAVRLGLAVEVSDSADAELERICAGVTSGAPSAVGRVKQVAAPSGLVEVLRRERQLNAAAWDGRVGG